MVTVAQSAVAAVVVQLAEAAVAVLLHLEEEGEVVLQLVVAASAARQPVVQA